MNIYLKKFFINQKGVSQIAVVTAVVVVLCGAFIFVKSRQSTNTTSIDSSIADNSLTPSPTTEPVVSTTYTYKSPTATPTPVKSGPTSTPTPGSSSNNSSDHSGGTSNVAVGYTISDSPITDTSAQVTVTGFPLTIRYQFPDSSVGNKTVFVRFFYANNTYIDQQQTVIYNPTANDSPTPTTGGTVPLPPTPTTGGTTPGGTTPGGTFPIPPSPTTASTIPVPPASKK